MKYYFWIEHNQYNLRQDTDKQFDPASMSKIFYALYLLATFSLMQLKQIEIPLTWVALRKYGHGTRRLAWRNLHQRYSLLDLLQYSLNNSCNVSTGLIADYIGRDKVNEFIATKLKLANTTIYSRATLNRTTVQDLVTTLRIIRSSGLLNEDNQNWLLETMNNTKRRTVIKQHLPDHLVYSKGGTTFSGLRRDMALVDDDSYVVIVQESDVLPKFNLFDRYFAHFHIGKFHQFLLSLDYAFNKYAAHLLEFEAN